MSDEAARPTDQTGPDRLRCRKCGCPHLPVLRTVHRLRTVIRYRVCRNCGLRMRTTEKISAEREPKSSRSGTNPANKPEPPEKRDPLARDRA